MFYFRRQIFKLKSSSYIIRNMTPVFATSGYEFCRARFVRVFVDTLRDRKVTTTHAEHVSLRR